jgi:hypothetical protein
MPVPDPGPFHIRDFTAWTPGGWDLDTQLPRQASRAPLPPVPLLPDAAWARRPGDHDWTGPGGACADCPAPSFLDATGPCTWGTR